jgi:hypothetical protein
MRPVRLTRPQRARLRLQVQLRLRLTNKQHRRLPPVPLQHLHRLPHPVRARNQVQARNLAQVQNRVRPRSRLLVQRLLRHPPANKMNLGTMKSNLVGRGSQTTENCFRSSGPFHAPGTFRPMDVPSRGTKVCNLFRPDLRLQTTCEHSSPWVQLGERFDLAQSVVATSHGPCSYQMTIREPRPTKFARYYVCS